jgi:hypothetical protein
MNAAKISLAEWDQHFEALSGNGLKQPFYGGKLSRHVAIKRDFRLRKLEFDNSPAALRLWNFLLTEEERLRAHASNGRRLVGAMKDLGTVPVMACSAHNLVAFYPDGAWWTPCLMEHSDGLFRIADALGFDESFCPVRAMLGAFVTAEHFPVPELLVCSAGAICDDFSAIAQHLEHLGFEILWWELPRRRAAEKGEAQVCLPGGLEAPQCQVQFVLSELERVRSALGKLAGKTIDDAALSSGIRGANSVRRQLRLLREIVFSADRAPLPALEMLIAEMLAIHFCSDLDETAQVLEGLIEVARERVACGDGILERSAVRLFWVNPVADLRAMNLVEECGGRICGTDYLFGHALAEIPEDIAPLEALARTALADRMIGSAHDRAAMVVQEMEQFRAEALVVCRIPGASHCAREGASIREFASSKLDIPTVEIEVAPLCDAGMPSLRSRLQALMETALSRRHR